MSRLHSRYPRPAVRHIEVPVKGYFMWVGSTLLTLLLAAHWLLPPPPPNPLISSRVMLPPIRIYAKARAPEGQADDDLASAIVTPIGEKEAPAEALSSSSAAPANTLPSEFAPALGQGHLSARRRAAAPAARTLNSRDAFAEFVPGAPKPMSSTQTRHRQTPKEG